MKISLGSDHGGVDLKDAIAEYLKSKGYDVIDCGTNGHESVDYPIYGEKAARLVAKGEADFGIVCCTSAEGIMISANKVKGIRCGLGYNDEVTEKMRQHNNANMVAFAGGFMKTADVLRRVDIYLSTPFEGGRHARRVDEIMAIENK